MPKRRRWGQGSVFRSGDQWVASLELPPVDGKRRQKRRERRTRQEALEELVRLRRQYGDGAATVTTLGDWLSDWLQLKADTVEPSTLRSYADHVRLHIDPMLGGIPLAELEIGDVDRLVAALKAQGKRPAGRVRIITTLRMALKAAVGRRMIPMNPADFVDLPTVEPYLVPAITLKDKDEIVGSVEGHWVEPLVRLLAGSGLRLGEAIGLDQGDLLLDEGYVRVRTSKTEPRAVPISDDAVAALRLALERATRIGPEQPVFWGQRGKSRRRRLRGDSVSHVVPRLLRDLRVGRLTPHGLRHGAATIMLTGGANLRMIQEQLGHTNPSMTARYAHVVPAAQRAAVRLLDPVSGEDV